MKPTQPKLLLATAMWVIFAIAAIIKGGEYHEAIAIGSILFGFISVYLSYRK
jgi:hypothetical protein